MKMKKTILLGAMAFGIFACGTNQKETTEETTTEEIVVEAAPVSYALNTEKSVTGWKGSMVGVYAHEGDLKFTEGTLTTKDGAITGGSFTIDMNSMVTTDDDALYKMAPREDLIGHLKSADFFGVEISPTANFVIKSVEGNAITGNLTIKDVTNQETVSDVELTESNGVLTATGSLVFDRQIYGVSYANSMNDMVLSDEIELTISIEGLSK